ncbi:MAG: tRNA (N(6)-L-threonylcarbamoyladenosine(37)-C(2))-methylthiotransferase [archaeon]
MTKVYIKTYGCTHNHADSEFMAGQLKQADYELVNNKDDADLIIINTCTVKDPSEKKFFSELKKIKQKVIVAGCIPQSDRKNPVLQNHSLIGVKQIHNIVQVVNETMKGNVVHLLQHTKDLPLNLPRVRRNPLVEIIPISSGCMGNCSFCKTKQARGGVLSFSEESIIKQIRVGLNEGAKEVWLTSEDSGAYGLDIKTTLPELLKKILEIPKDFKIRLGMINPEYVKRYNDELIDIFKDERMFKFIHIPVQSGNNKVLKDMNRPYNIEDFKDSVNKLRKGIPSITISTDIICGFPEETDEEFQDTLNLVKEIKFPIINISKFYPRAGTKALRLKPLPTKVKKARSKELTDLNQTLIDNKEWLGWKGEVIVDQEGKQGTFLGRNDYYRLVVLKEKNVLGKKVKVRIVKVLRDYFIGEIV